MQVIVGHAVGALRLVDNLPPAVLRRLRAGLRRLASVDGGQGQVGLLVGLVEQAGEVQLVELVDRVHSPIRARRNPKPKSVKPFPKINNKNLTAGSLLGRANWARAVPVFCVFEAQVLSHSCAFRSLAWPYRI